MMYNPKIHHRRSIRLKGYDYSKAGAYFITICCDDMDLKFGTIDTPDRNNSDAVVKLNEFGHIAYSEWAKLPQRFSDVELDVFQIMPNHVHGIIVLSTTNNIVGATIAVAPNHTGNDDTVAPNKKGNDDGGDRAGASPAPTIGNIIGAYKSLVANGCLELFKNSIAIDKMHENENMGKIWQRNYHEHIIRNEQAYRIISKYIIDNPKKWKEDKFFKM